MVQGERNASLLQIAEMPPILCKGMKNIRYKLILNIYLKNSFKLLKLFKLL